MSALGLATRGYVCGQMGPTIVTTVQPRVDSEDYAPKIESRDTRPSRDEATILPDFKPKFKPKKGR